MKRVIDAKKNARTPTTTSASTSESDISVTPFYSFTSTMAPPHRRDECRTSFDLWERWLYLKAHETISAVTIPNIPAEPSA